MHTKCTIQRQKIQKFSGEGTAPFPIEKEDTPSIPLSASILRHSALDLAPEPKSWIRQCSRFGFIMQRDWQTDRITEEEDRYTHATTVGERVKRQ